MLVSVGREKKCHEDLGFIIFEKLEQKECHAASRFTMYIKRVQRWANALSKAVYDHTDLFVNNVTHFV